MNNLTSHESNPIQLDSGADSRSSLKKNWENRISMVLLSLALLMPTVVTTGCDDDPVINSKPNPNEKPSEQYEYTRKVSSLTVEDGTFIKVDRTGNPNKVLVGNTVVFEFRGNLSIMFGGNIINGEFEITEPGDLYLCRGSDIVGEPCKIIVEKKGPEVSVLKDTINVFGGVAAEINTNSLKLGNAVVMEWPDGCKVEISFIDGSGNKKVIQNGDMLLDSGTLVSHVEKDGKSTEKRVNLVCESIKGLNEWANELNNKKVRVGDVVNIGEGITCGRDIEISSVYVVNENGNEYSVDNPIPYMGTYRIWVNFVNINSGQSYNVLSDSSFEVEARAYKAPEFQKVNPKDYWPRLEKLNDLNDIQKSDPEVQKIIDNLEHIAYAMGLRKMMLKYGTTKLTPSEYKSELERIVPCMIGENNGNYTYIGSEPVSSATTHSEIETGFLEDILQDCCNMVVIDIDKAGSESLCLFTELGANELGKKNHYIGANTHIAKDTGGAVKNRNKEWLENMCNSDDKLLILPVGDPEGGKKFLSSAGVSGEEFNKDDWYSYASYADKANADGNTRVIVICGTGLEGRSLIPNLFLGRSIAAGNHSPNNSTESYDPYYNATSYLSYDFLAVVCLLTQLLKGAGLESLNMNEITKILLDNADKTYIGSGSEKRELNLLSSSNIVKKYFMPKISEEIYFAGDEVRLEKTCPFNVYSGVGIKAVLNNGEKIPVTAENLKYLKQFNPKDVEYYYSPSLLKEYGYAPGSLTSIICKTELVDENWNTFCSVEKPVTISMDASYQANLNTAHIDNDESLSYNADVPTFHDDINISPIYTGAPADESQMFDSADEKNSYATQISGEDNPISYTEIIDAIPTGYDSKAVEKLSQGKYGKNNEGIVYNNSDKKELYNSESVKGRNNYAENLISTFITEGENIDYTNGQGNFGETYSNKYTTNLFDANSEEGKGGNSTLTYNYRDNIEIGRSKKGGSEYDLAKK